MQSMLSPGVLPSTGDEVLRQFVLDSDEEMEDSPSAKRDNRTNLEMTVFGDDDIIEMRVVVSLFSFSFTASNNDRFQLTNRSFRLSSAKAFHQRQQASRSRKQCPGQRITDFAR
jgi:hypothetical protein